ncbi:hypothetical protein LR48_Vigan03g155300 [Vigna angularis]|uniref:Uncharacterized protein n=1 Tax=Phaseolus angularis TaxID=3914 RepID=A0A0L9U5X5_PHAAN|nr:hypothetical protein LR48_Vigan03g155300 [Vigna angularis]
MKSRYSYGRFGADNKCSDIVDVASKKGAKAATLRVDNLTKVGGENTSGEDYDGNVVTLSSQSEVAKVVDFSGESVDGLGTYVKTVEEGEDRGKKVESGGSIVTTTSENKVEHAVVLSVDGSKVVGVEEEKDGGSSKELSAAVRRHWSVRRPLDLVRLFTRRPPPPVPESDSLSAVTVLSGDHWIWFVSSRDDHPHRCWSLILLHPPPRAASLCAANRCVLFTRRPLAVRRSPRHLHSCHLSLLSLF